MIAVAFTMKQYAQTDLEVHRQVSPARKTDPPAGASQNRAFTPRADA
jgi:hypothetical protein